MNDDMHVREEDGIETADVAWWPRAVAERQVAVAVIGPGGVGESVDGA